MYKYICVCHGKLLSALIKIEATNLAGLSGRGVLTPKFQGQVGWVEFQSAHGILLALGSILWNVSRVQDLPILLEKRDILFDLGVFRLDANIGLELKLKLVI